MLTLNNIHKEYDGKKILKGIDLNVSEGETISIIGPSGSGKTTLLRCINLLEIPDEGTMAIDNTIFDSSNYTQNDVLTIRRKTSMVFQQYALFLNKTALENITDSLIITRGVNKKNAIEKGEQLLSQFGLLEHKEKYPYQLSGGQQQRVGIARAIALEPKIILFDEPTSALDPELIGEILDIIKQVSKMGITMVIVTHEMKFAYDISDRIIFIDQGNILESGSPEEVMVHSKFDRTKEFLDNFVI